MTDQHEIEPKQVVGYIIMAGNNNYLGSFDMSIEGDVDPLKKLVWAGGKLRPEDARVFDSKLVARMSESVTKDGWDTKPTHAIPAIWSETGGVIITGEKIAFDQIPPLKENNITSAE